MLGLITPKILSRGKIVGGDGERKRFFSVRASLPKDLASVEKNLTFSCYIEWSLNLCIHYMH